MQIKKETAKGMQKSVNFFRCALCEANASATCIANTVTILNREAIYRKFFCLYLRKRYLFIAVSYHFAKTRRKFSNNILSMHLHALIRFNVSESVRANRTLKSHKLGAGT